MTNFIKFTLLLMLLNTFCSFTAAQTTCDTYPSQDFIVIDWNVSQQVIETEVLGEGDLPSGWALESQSRLEWPEYKKIIAKDQSNLRKFPYYGEDGSYFEYVLEQNLITSKDNEVHLSMEVFKDSAAPGILFKNFKAMFGYTYVDVSDTQDIPVANGQCFMSEVRGGPHILVFTNGNKFFEVIGDDENELKDLMKRYTNIKKSIKLHETSKKDVLICKDHASVCNTEIQYAPYSETVDLQACFTNHSGSTIDCPQQRRDKYTTKYVLQFPVCEKGDIITYEYNKDITYPISSQFWSSDDLWINNTYPVSILQITLTTPKTTKLYFNSPISPQTQSLDNITVYSWELRDIPPYEIEKNMPEYGYVLDSISYSSVNSWLDLEPWLEERFKVYVEPDENITELAKNIVNASPTDLQKAQALTRWVSQNIRYEEHELGFATGYEPNWPKKVVEYKFGDCKDQATLLTALARAQNLTAYPVVIASKGYETTEPNMYVFPHAVTAFVIDGKIDYADPTCRFCPFGYLTPEFQENDAFILLDNLPGFVKTPQDKIDEDNHQEINYSVVASGQKYGTLELTLHNSGFESIMMREYVDNFRKEVNDEFLWAVPDTCVQMNEEFDVIQNSTPLEITLKKAYNCTNLLESTGNYKELTPLVEFNYNELMQDKKRAFPIKFTTNHHITYNTILEAPDGYAASNLSEKASAKTKYLDYEISYTQDGRHIIQTVEYNIKKGQIPAEDYEEFKTSMKEFQQILKKPITLKRAEQETQTTPTPKTTNNEAENVKAQEKNPPEQRPQQTAPEQPTSSNISLVAVIIALLAVIAILLLKRQK